MFDRYLQDTVPLSDAINYYRKEGDLSDLVRAAEVDEYRSNALYILSEIGDRAAGVLKDIVPYVSDSEQRSAYWALDILHAYASKDDYELLYLAISGTYLKNEVLLAKCCEILSDISVNLLVSLYRHAINENANGEHILGLFLLCSCSDSQNPYLADLLRSDSPIALLYACAAIVRNYPADDGLVPCLPRMIQEDLKLRAR